MRNGDKLKIFAQVEKSIIWDGIIDLKECGEYTANGIYMRNNQKGISREEWASYFFNKYQARLQKNE